MMLLVALLIPICIGLAAFKIADSSSRFKNVSFYLYIVLGVALGAGLCSFLYFISLWLFEKPMISALLELVLLTALILLRKKWSVFFTDLKPTNKTVLITNRICIALFIICLINTLDYFLWYTQRSPNGQWDAIQIWNLKARFLYLGGHYWRGMFSSLMPSSHPDYPVFLPGFIAHCWMLMKTDATSAAIVTSAFFTFATGLVLFLSLSHFKGIFQGLVAGLLLLSTPGFINHGTSQYADITIGFLFLATFVCLAMADEAGDNSYFFLIIAGLFAGFAAWTKNEGNLFFIIVLLSRALMVILKPSKINLKKLSFFVLGALPVIILVIAYKQFLTPANDIMAGQKGHVMEKLKDFSRYKIIFSHIWKTGMDFGEWTTKPHLWLLAFLLLFGFQVKKNLQLNVISSFIAIFLTMAGYFFIYVTTPFDLVWHIESSLNRLLYQLFPSFLFLYFLALRPFELSLPALTVTKEKKPVAKPVVKGKKSGKK